ncbi:MAG TPA: phosphoribosylformylglycinamidine synthase subunit PurL [Acidobacteriaceae bacterium]|nr:phosphoribosylformylglycinamidine synthase subunit PurL [Acidobacteriaceae bacterium]
MATPPAETVLDNPKSSAPAHTPTPAEITPALLKTHSITTDEYARIEKLMGRTPSLTELGIFSVMWSEHCSYKSSRVHLKRLPTRGTRTSGPGSVVQGPGENAGIIDVGDGWACAFKIESHNHPSYIEPYQGAATGVGGILRDIFTMNARPLAVMDSLRFGPLDEAEPDAALRSKNHQVVNGVVAGIAGYGNCFGVPNLGGETRFEPCYSGNPLVNAFALGLVRTDEIFYAKAAGVGNPVIYVGAKTGRDGIHGATMASEEFTEGSEQKRPNVQMGDPFMEKLLLEACLEAMATGAVVGIQDMGAAGLTCSTCEMGARGELGLTIELDKVPQRETGMSSYEIMLSESQERMLLVADKGREDEVLRVFSKWGLDASIVGIVTADDTMRVLHSGVLVAEIPNKALTDDAPVYKRPVGEWKAPVPLNPPAHILEELKKPRDYTADLKKLLASANICDKRWVFEQYDSMVQTNTVEGPGSEAGVMRMKDSSQLSVHSSQDGASQLRTENSELTTGAQRGIAMALAGNGRWCWLDPKLGAMHAVAEAARKVACTGATPVAATNCLNFGNPEKPEIMAQLSAAIDGIAEVCTALDVPITGGNVSLYNETKGEGIYPTPVVGVVGLLDDVTKAVPSGFQKAGDVVLHVYATDKEPLTIEQRKARFLQILGATEFARTAFNEFWGEIQTPDLQGESALNSTLAKLATSNLISSANDVGSGGLAVCLAKCMLAKGIGAEVDPMIAVADDDGPHLLDALSIFMEDGGVLVTCCPESEEKITAIAQSADLACLRIGVTGGQDLRIVAINGKSFVNVGLNDLRAAYSGVLESQLASEVVTG